MDSPRVRCVLPASPCLCLDEMSIRDLQLLTEFFEGLSEACLLSLNKPRFIGPSAKFADSFFDQVVGGWRDIVRLELEARTPSTQDEARIRAEALVRDWALDGRFADIADLAASVADSGIAEKS